MTEIANTSLANLDQYVPQGAKVVELSEADGLLVHVLESDKYKPGEQVILEVSEPKAVACLWEPGDSGSSLMIETLAGNGSLVTIEIGTGEEQRTALTTGVKTQVKPGTIYWYENNGLRYDPLLVLDTCVGFDETHEPTIARVHEQLQNIDFTTL
jgi:hypothetical protein